MAEGKSYLSCLEICDEKISFANLKQAVPAKTFDAWESHIQQVEIQQVN